MCSTTTSGRVRAGVPHLNIWPEQEASMILPNHTLKSYVCFFLIRELKKNYLCI